MLQGFAGGVFPLAYGVIRDTFPPEQMPMAVGALSISVGVGAGFGPALAGIVVEHAGPSAIFWVGVVGAVPMLFAPLVIHDRPDSARTPLDLPGALLLSTALIALLLAISTSGEHRAVTALAGGLGVLAIVAMVVWVRVERRVADPLIRLEVLTNRTVALVNAIAACVGFATFVVYSSVAPFLQAPESTGYGFGMSVAVSGAWLIPHGVLLMAIAPLAGWACKHHGPRLVLLVGTFGTTLCAASFTLFHGSVAAIVIPVSVLGAAHGCTLTAMANLVVDAVRPDEIGVSTGLNMVARTLGMAFGAAISAAVLAAGVREATGLTGAGSYTITYAIAGLAAAGAAACAVAVRPARRPVARDAPGGGPRRRRERPLTRMLGRAAGGDLLAREGGHRLDRRAGAEGALDADRAQLLRDGRRR